MNSFEQTNLTRKAAFEKALNADPGIAENGMLQVLALPLMEACVFPKHGRGQH